MSTMSTTLRQIFVTSPIFFIFPSDVMTDLNPVHEQVAKSHPPQVIILSSFGVFVLLCILLHYLLKRQEKRKEARKREELESGNKSNTNRTNINNNNKNNKNKNNNNNSNNNNNNNNNFHCFEGNGVCQCPML